MTVRVNNHSLDRETCSHYVLVHGYYQTTAWQLKCHQPALYHGKTFVFKEMQLEGDCNPYTCIGLIHLVNKDLGFQHS